MSETPKKEDIYGIFTNNDLGAAIFKDIELSEKMIKIAKMQPKYFVKHLSCKGFSKVLLLGPSHYKVETMILKDKLLIFKGVSEVKMNFN